MDIYHIANIPLFSSLTLCIPLSTQHWDVASDGSRSSPADLGTLTGGGTVLLWFLMRSSARWTQPPLTSCGRRDSYPLVLTALQMCSFPSALSTQASLQLPHICQLARCCFSVVSKVLLHNFIIWQTMSLALPSLIDCLGWFNALDGLNPVSNYS